MVESIVEKLIKQQLKENTITLEEVNIYKYGYTLVCELIINILLAVVIGIVFNDLHNVLIFLVLYIPLRSFCGGWHASKIWKCTILSNLVLIVLVVVDEYIVEKCSVTIILAIFVMFATLVFFISPIDTKNKPISANERIVYKKKINVMILVHMLIFAIMLILERKNVIYVLSFVYVTQAIMLLLEVFNKWYNHTLQKEEV